MLTCVVGGLLGYGIERQRLVQSGTHGFDDMVEPWFYRDGDCFFVNVGAMLTFLGRLKVSRVNGYCIHNHTPLCIDNHMLLGIGTQGTQNTECGSVLFGNAPDTVDHLVLVRLWTSKHTSWPPKRPWT